MSRWTWRGHQPEGRALLAPAALRAVQDLGVVLAELGGHLEADHDAGDEEEQGSKFHGRQPTGCRRAARVASSTAPGGAPEEVLVDSAGDEPEPRGAIAEAFVGDGAWIPGVRPWSPAASRRSRGAARSAGSARSANVSSPIPRLRSAGRRTARRARAWTGIPSRCARPSASRSSRTGGSRPRPPPSARGLGRRRRGSDRSSATRPAGSGTRPRTPRPRTRIRPSGRSRRGRRRRARASARRDGSRRSG